MDTDNFEKYNKDFSRALNIYENDYSHTDLIEFLQSGSVAEKQAAALKLDGLHNKSDAEIFMSNLTGCDGKVREAVSFRLNEFVKINPEYFTDFADIFLDAIIDINGNICRNTISALKYIKNFPEFTTCFCTKLTQNTLELVKKAANFDIQDGKYKINKEIFKLYWYLETIYEFLEFINSEVIENILFSAKNIQDYTIREKVAKILSKFENDNLIMIKEELKQDENYYVRRL